MADLFSLEGKRAIVTGGSRGIGQAIAAELLARGARVIITARGKDALEATARDLGERATAIACDNADPAAIEAMLTESFAAEPVDILVNNAGVSPYYKRAEDVTVEDWTPLIDINLRGTFFCSTGFARRLFAASRPGVIVNIASVGGLIPMERLSVYGGAKAGIIQITRQLALEWAERGIRVNAIAPGWTESDFTAGLFASRWGEKLRADIPAGRFARPEDIAGTAAYLASDASSYVTGAVIPVDGGRLIR